MSRIRLGELTSGITTMAAAVLLLFSFALTTTPVAAKPIGGDFRLTDHQGETFDLKQQRGKVVVMFFGYTWCPMICPESLAHMARVLRELEDKADQVKVVFISVDPERDTVEKLSQYVPYFNSQLVGLTGTVAEVKQVANAYHARFTLQKTNPDDKLYTVDHSADIYVLGRDGKVAGIIPYGMPVQHILKVISSVLEEQPLNPLAEKVPVPPAQLLAKVDDASVIKPPWQAFQPLDLKGKKLDLSTYAGQPLVINFWASWCPPCRAELPALNRAWHALRDEGVVMLAVNVGESASALTAFLDDYPIDFPVFMDQAGDSMAQWQIKGMPTTIMLNRGGDIIHHIAGERVWDSEAVLAQIRHLAD